MPRFAISALALALGLAAALALASCGGSDAQLLPGETATEINDNLDKVRELSDEGDCAGAESAAQEVGEQIEALQEVDPKLKKALEAGAERLNQVIATCEEASEETEATTLPEETAERTIEKPKKEQKPKGKAEKGEPAPAREPPPASGELPPQSQGEGKGIEEGGGPPAAEGEEKTPPSGGVGPGSPVEGE